MMATFDFFALWCGRLSLSLCVLVLLWFAVDSLGCWIGSNLCKGRSDDAS